MRAEDLKKRLISEAKQLTAIFVAAPRTAKRNNWQLAIGNRQSRKAKRHDRSSSNLDGR
jgi:hypothetical protein